MCCFTVCGNALVAQNKWSWSSSEHFFTRLRGLGVWILMLSSCCTGLLKQHEKKHLNSPCKGKKTVLFSEVWETAPLSPIHFPRPSSNHSGLLAASPVAHYSKFSCGWVLEMRCVSRVESILFINRLEETAWDFLLRSRWQEGKGRISSRRVLSLRSLFQCAGGHGAWSTADKTQVFLK